MTDILAIVGLLCVAAGLVLVGLLCVVAALVLAAISYRGRPTIG